MATRPEHASNTRKRALIICNYEYKQSNCSLNYVRGNAEKLQDQLESIGFHVKKEMNVDNSIMDIFQNLQKEVQKGDLVLVYFFGLSCHVDNQNYLLAVGVYDDKDDILDKSNDAERMITRLVEETQANAIVFILDCCKPYELKSVGDPESNIKGNGLVPMKSLAHTFVQFACSAKETVDDDLFFKHLLRNLNRENVPISTVFQDIAEDVYDERGSEQKLYQDGLSNVNSVYLNEVKQERCSADNIKKHALIIGNDTYSKREHRLTHSIDNARKLGDILRKMKFTVTKHENLTEKRRFMKQVIHFTKTFKNGDLVLYYFSGHALQLNENNYLIPTDDTKLQSYQAVEAVGASLKRIIGRLTESKPDCVYILILDCSRPYLLSGGPTATVAVSKPGLHRMNAPDGRKVFIQFSYAANETTNDDLFNKHLLRNIDRANVHISNVFRDIAEDVYRKRRRQLETYSTSTLPENQPVYLNEVSVTRVSPNNIEKRAFIIRNENYARVQNRLTTSINAEKRLDDTLQDINFTVISLENVAEEDEMMERTIAFTRKFKNGDIIVFYFSGHGSQYDGNNYLIPTNDTTITSEQDVEVFGVNVKRMVDRLTERKPDCVFILIFDCCRSYSLNRGSTATTTDVLNRGLHSIEVPNGSRMLIQFSCAANKKTNDDLFNKHLLRNIDRGNVSIDKLFQNIGENVYRQRRRQLRPYFTSGLAEDEPIYLNEVEIIRRARNNIGKWAFIIGNDNYALEANQLTNSISNAERLDDILTNINFTVNRLQDVEEENEMMNQIIAFAKAFRNGDIVVFYFSGHSSQSNRNNYLILTNDTNIDTEQDIEIFGANLEEIIDRLTENKPDCLFILIFDCCRPYSINGESTNNPAVLYRGLHTIKIPEKRKGFILFACPVDKTINDNVFSKHLLRNIGRENVRITDVLHGIGEDVYYNRRRRLRPYFTSELLDDQPIYLSEVNIIRGPFDNSQKHALIVSNQNYSSQNQLAVSINNTTKLTDLLHKDNIIVTNSNNLAEEDDIMSQVISFGKTFNNCALVLCYFSGHALQFDRQNYFIPTNDIGMHSCQDVEAVGVNLKQIIDRLTESKPDCVLILILDCCRPYIFSRVTGRNRFVMPEKEGLADMKVPDGRKVFIQFSCALNTTVADNFFNKHLMLNIYRKNLPVDEVFHDIVKGVFEERSRQLRPYSINKLPDDKLICLNFMGSSLPKIRLDATWRSNAHTRVGNCEPGSTIGRLRSPQGISMMKNQSLLIADSSNHRIIKYNLHKKIKRVAGKNMEGYASDLLAKPSNVIFHHQTKSFIICDFHNRRLLQWFPGSKRCATTLLENIACFDVATDVNGDLYISNPEEHEVRRYRIGDRHGELVAGGHGQGRRSMQLNHPTYICIGDDFSVYVSDSGNHRVVEWQRNAERGFVVAGSAGRGKSRRQLDTPAGVVIDQKGTIYVADSGNHRVMRYRQGEEIDRIAGDPFRAGGSACELNGPEGLAFDNEGNLYVADSNNHRIQRFRIRKP